MNQAPSSVNIERRLSLLLVAIVVTIGLVLASRYNYLLFHTLAEGFSIVIAGAMFVLVWNTWELTEHGFLQFLGVAFLFISILDLVHAMAYEGMKIFPGYEANLPTQLWIAARYVQAVSLFIAPSFRHRNLRRRDRYLIAGIYAVITTALLVLIFTRLFPDCYSVGQGLTPFKIVSEYVISVLLLIAIWRLYRRRDDFSADIFPWLVAAIAFTILSELAFTTYVSLYGSLNLVGHILKIWAFYCLYRAIIETGLRKPYALLFEDLKRRNKQLAQEIAERKRIEENLRKYHNIVSSTPDGVAFLDRDYRYLIVNDAYERFSATKREDLIGLSVSEYLGRDVFHQVVKPHFDRCLDGEVITYREWFEYPLLGWRFVEVTYFPYRDKDDNIAGVVSNTRDITKRKRAQDAYRNLVEFSLQGLCIIQDGKVVFANPALVEMFGYTLDELLAMSPEEASSHLTPEGREFIRQQRYAHQHDKAFVNRYEVQVYTKTGELRWTEQFVTPITYQGSEALQIAVVDITERKRAEEELNRYQDHLEELVDRRTEALIEAQQRLADQERLAALGQFAGGIAHDLRQPLSVINNAAYFLKTYLSEPDDQVADYLDMLEEESHHAGQIITDLLEFARTGQVRAEAVAIPDLVAAVLEKHPPPEGVTNEYCSPDELPRVYVDPGHIRQVLGNLVKNAYQAMPDGGELTISVGVDQAEIEVTITDTGTGISPDNIEKIFEPLFSTKKGGVGLGLTISKKLVEANGGRLTVESQSGEGTSFTLSLPVYKAQP